MTSDSKFARSYLYVPADRLERLVKAPSYGSDAIIVDLEDGVSPSNKALARSNARTWLVDHSSGENIWARINPRTIDEDLDAVVQTKLSGIVLPKSSSARDIDSLSDKLKILERERGISEPIRICALIESAQGVLNAQEIANRDRVRTLILGELDLRADLRLPLSANDQMLAFARNSIVYASAAAGINPPIASVRSDFTNLDAFEESTVAYFELGYFGRTCIHPNQIPIVNKVFTISNSEREGALDILCRLELAGGGVALDAQGKMIDEAIARNARRILELGSN